MNKTQFYLSQCAEAASKSHMCFTLGAIMVKGGKVMSSGYNHHRPHYDGSDVRTHGHRKPVSMHAEMHAIFSFTGMSPSFKTQVQGLERRVSQPTQPKPRSKGSKGAAGPEDHPSGPTAFCDDLIERHDESIASTDFYLGGGGSSSGEEYSGSESPSPCPGGHSRSSTSLCGVPEGARTASRISPPKETDKLWDSRRRDSRANGADIYVARFTKNGFGSAKPCWRCLEWCRWAGVKRIFHWNAEEGKFDVVKVNSAESGQYETHADIRLFAGLGWCP